MKKLVAYGTLTALLALALVSVQSVSAQTTNLDNTATNTVDNMTTTDDMTTTTTTTTPGLPSTGVGGESGVTMAIVAGTGLVALGGAAILARRMYQ
jgi:hypothetical protein